MSTCVERLPCNISIDFFVSAHRNSSHFVRSPCHNQTQGFMNGFLIRPERNDIAGRFDHLQIKIHIYECEHNQWLWLD